MLIQQKLGNIQTIEISNRILDVLPLEWFETNKRILHKKTRAGRDIILKFLKEDPDLKQDEVIYQDDVNLIMIEIQPCEAIVVQPATMYEMASLCYEIGNKHLPLFTEGDEVLVPYEAPLFHLLAATGFKPLKEKRKLLHSIKSSVSPHSHGNGASLFSRILQITNASPNV